MYTPFVNRSVCLMSRRKRQNAPQLSLKLMRTSRGAILTRGGAGQAGRIQTLATQACQCWS